MAESKTLSTTIDLNVPAAKLWETIKCPDVVIKLMPDFISGCEYLEGEGGVGSIRLMKFGPAVAEFVSFSKEKLEIVDEAGKSLTYSVIDGELLNYFKLYRVTVSVCGDGEDSKCTVNWGVEYESVNPDIAPPEIAKEGAITTFKTLEAYINGTLPGPPPP